MSKPNYILIGHKDIFYGDRRLYDGKKPGKINGELHFIASGGAKTVISAACAADCGVLLLETTQPK